MRRFLLVMVIVSMVSAAAAIEAAAGSPLDPAAQPGPAGGAPCEAGWEYRADTGCARRRSDGLLEYSHADGSTSLSHGPDPDIWAEPVYAAATAAAFTQERAVRCRDATQNRVVMVYAYISGTTNRIDTYRTGLRADMRRMNYFLNENSLRSSSTSPHLADLRVECSGDGYIRVIPAAIPRPPASSGRTTPNFSDTRTALVAAGLDDLKAKYLVAADWASNYVGLGELYPDDSRSIDNRSNIGATYAMVFGASNFGPGVLMHELGHTMGAVQASANHSSGAGHCLDELDVLCYKDSANVTTTLECEEVVRFDCGSNDYFDTNTASGQYLATKWNIGWEANRFIYIRPE